jgi:hypothetical protein
MCDARAYAPCASELWGLNVLYTFLYASVIARASILVPTVSPFGSSSLIFALTDSMYPFCHGLPRSMNRSGSSQITSTAFISPPTWFSQPQDHPPYAWLHRSGRNHLQELSFIHNCLRLCWRCSTFQPPDQTQSRLSERLYYTAIFFKIHHRLLQTLSHPVPSTGTAILQSCDFSSHPFFMILAPLPQAAFRFDRPLDLSTSSLETLRMTSSRTRRAVFPILDDPLRAPPGQQQRWSLWAIHARRPEPSSLASRWRMPLPGTFPPHPEILELPHVTQTVPAGTTAV